MNGTGDDGRFELASSRQNEPGFGTGERSRRVSGRYSPAVKRNLRKTHGQHTADRPIDWPFGRNSLSRNELGHVGFTRLGRFARMYMLHKDGMN